MLTEPFIRSAPEGTHWDGSLKGFGLRVGKTRKTFIVLIASGHRKSIGVWPLVSLATARAEAKRLLAEKTLGKIRPPRTPFEDALKEYLADCAQRNRPRTVYDYTRLLTRHFPFGRKALADITPREILQNLYPLPPSERTHAMNTGKVFFRWCVYQHLIDRSPMQNMPPTNLKLPRTRVLDEDELGAVYRTARALKGPFPAVVALLCLTGQRRGEIVSLQWDWVRGDTVTLPLTKNGRPHTFPIGPEAQNLLADLSKIVGSPYVFPASRKVKDTTTVFNGFGYEKARFDKACSVRNWTLHDIRRSVATGMQRLGVEERVIEALLNHTRPGIIPVYQRYDFLPQMRDAILKWEAYITTLDPAHRPQTQVQPLPSPLFAYTL